MEALKMHGEGYCMKCHGYMFIVLGALILANIYWLGWDWWQFVGAVFVLKGVVMAWKPSCPCNDGKKK